MFAVDDLVAPVPARRRVLADVGSASVDAKALHVARRAVRHVAPAADQDRRARCRDENDDPDSFADIMSRPGNLALRTRTDTAPRHLSDGARGPENQTRPVNPKTLPLRTLARRRSRTGASASQEIVIESSKNRAARDKKVKALHNAG